LQWFHKGNGKSLEKLKKKLGGELEGIAHSKEILFLGSRERFEKEENSYRNLNVPMKKGAIGRDSIKPSM